MTKRKIRAAIYTRISSSDGDNEKNDSIESQLNRCQSYIESQGWERIEHFSDVNKSGYDVEVERERFEDLENGVRSRDFEKVVVWRIDRISRRAFTTTKFAKLLKEHHVELVTPDSGGLDTLMLGVLAAIAESESEVMSYRLRTRFHDDFLGVNKEGKPKPKIGGQRPYGYRVVKDSNEKPVQPYYEKIEHEAEAVREMADWILADVDGPLRSSELIDQLTAKGYKTQHGNPWKWNAVRNKVLSPVVANYFTRGDLAKDGHCLMREGYWPAIIEPDDYAKICTRFGLRISPSAEPGVFILKKTLNKNKAGEEVDNRNQKVGKRSQGFTRKGLLSGVLVTSKGNPMYAITHPAGTEMYAANSRGDGTTINRDLIDAYVLDWIETEMLEQGLYDEQQPGTPPARTLETVTSDLEEVGRRIEVALIQATGPGSESNKIQVILDDLYEREEDLNNELKAVERGWLRREDYPPEDFPTLPPLVSLKKGLEEATMSKKQGLVRHWIERVEVGPLDVSMNSLRERHGKDWRKVHDKEMVKLRERTTITPRKQADRLSPVEKLRLHVSEEELQQADKAMGANKLNIDARRAV